METEDILIKPQVNQMFWILIQKMFFFLMIILKQYDLERG